MTIQKHLDLGDQILPTGKYEEITFAICFLKSKRENYTETTFDRIGAWFDKGVFNWAIHFHTLNLHPHLIFFSLLIYLDYFCFIKLINK